MNNFQAMYHMQKAMANWYVKEESLIKSRTGYSFYEKTWWAMRTGAIAYMYLSGQGFDFEALSIFNGHEGKQPNDSSPYEIEGASHEARMLALCLALAIMEDELEEARKRHKAKKRGARQRNF